MVVFVLTGTYTSMMSAVYDINFVFEDAMVCCITAAGNQTCTILLRQCSERG